MYVVYVFSYIFPKKDKLPRSQTKLQSLKKVQGSLEVVEMYFTNTQSNIWEFPKMVVRPKTPQNDRF